MPNVYVIGGCNGSGKTTASLVVLPSILDCHEYVNADAIAAGLSPLNPDAMAILAGRLMLQRLRELMAAQVDFAFESTLAARSFVLFLQDCKAQGYLIHLAYFWLRSPELAIARVARRVASGGHDIPETIIRRRYDRSLQNLRELYLPLCDSWLIFDNSETRPEPIARYMSGTVPLIQNEVSWKIMMGESV
jgi:predicted ABC-type ATPase